MMFIRSLITVSMGARISEKRMKPMMMGCSLIKPKSVYNELLLINTEKRVKI